MSNSDRESKGQIVWFVLVSFLAIYVMAPVVLLFPVEALRRHKILPSLSTQTELILFAPLMKLDSICPPYHALIEWEANGLEKFLPAER